MAECSHDCGSCGEDCPSKKGPKDFIEKLNDASSVKRVIGVVSGKGGVGKSMVTSILAVLFNRRGYKTAVLDADVTGPSIPKAFGIKEKAKGCDFGLLPVTTKTGIDVMSVNLLLPNETDPVVWRGPIIAGTVKQFWTDTVWKDIDYMFVDMPPGTGDVPLTVFQSIPVDGIVIVTSPQELVSMIVGKAVKMAKMMNIPILGVVENMSYFECPDCGKRHSIYGESHIEQVAADFGVDVIAKLPIDPQIAKCADTGTIELFNLDCLDSAADAIEDKTK
ncbi:MAG: P-loop NTPase [Acutalibacteraceae bacterium]